MTAFVLGATGFVGREVVRQLCVRGATPIAHVRPDSKQLDDWRKRFAELGADVDTTSWDVAALAARLQTVQRSPAIAGSGSDPQRASMVIGHPDSLASAVCIRARSGSTTGGSLMLMTGSVSYCS